VFRFGPRTDGSGPGEPAEFWIGSADLMHRNLDRRVEALVQVTEPAAQAALDRVLAASMSDEVGGFDLDGAGAWHRRDGSPDVPLADLQEILLRRTLARAD
jgi:polyphosphate kinase